MLCQVYAKLTGAHKSSVTKLLVLGAREQGGPDFLLSCSADGTVAVWEPSAAAPQGPDKEISAKVTWTLEHSTLLLPSSGTDDITLQFVLILGSHFPMTSS